MSEQNWTKEWPTKAGDKTMSTRWEKIGEWAKRGMFLCVLILIVLLPVWMISALLIIDGIADKVQKIEQNWKTAQLEWNEKIKRLKQICKVKL
jgi:hypothetical protein